MQLWVARSWNCKKQAGCSMQLGLQEATRVQEAGIARSKQCSKQLWVARSKQAAACSCGLQEAGIARSNQGAACSWGCKKQAGCKKQLGLQGANSAASSCGLQEASRVQHAAGIARSKQCSKQLGWQEATGVLHATEVARSKQGAACNIQMLPILDLPPSNLGVMLWGGNGILDPPTPLQTPPIFRVDAMGGGNGILGPPPHCRPPFPSPI